MQGSLEARRPYLSQARGHAATPDQAFPSHAQRAASLERLRRGRRTPTLRSETAEFGARGTESGKKGQERTEHLPTPTAVRVESDRFRDGDLHLDLSQCPADVPGIARRASGQSPGLHHRPPGLPSAHRRARATSRMRRRAPATAEKSETSDQRRAMGHTLSSSRATPNLTSHPATQPTVEAEAWRTESLRLHALATRRADGGTEFMRAPPPAPPPPPPRPARRGAPAPPRSAGTQACSRPGPA